MKYPSFAEVPSNVYRITPFYCVLVFGAARPSSLYTLHIAQCYTYPCPTLFVEVLKVPRSWDSHTANDDNDKNDHEDSDSSLSSFSDSSDDQKKKKK